MVVQPTVKATIIKTKPDKIVKERYRELLLSDVTDNLEFLRSHVLSLGRDLRGKRRPIGFVDMDGLARTAQTLVNRLNGKEDLLGLPRITRILRHRAGPVWGISLATDFPDIEATIKWLDQVVENIEDELDAIDRKRVMWATVFSAVISSLALLVAIITVAISVFIHT